jgi:hypothetical protein
MSTIINATTTNGVVIQPDNSGSLVLQSNGTTIMTVGSTGVSTQVGAPAFSAYANAGQSLSSATATKILYGVEEFDTNSNFASSRFTPTVAGYYQINAQSQPNDSYTGSWIAIYKNGSLHRYGNFYLGGATYGGAVVSSLVYLNGSTDYVEIYVLFNGGQPIASGPQFTYFNGFLARSA